MTVRDLNRSQLAELKANYMAELGRNLSFYDIYTIDELVPDEEVYEYYANTYFTPDDFYSGVEGAGKLDARLKTHRGQIKDEIDKKLERVGDRVWSIRNGDISTQIIELAYYASNGDMKYARETQDEFMNLLYDAYVTINKARSLANKI